ncbi:MAG: hypothetical protein A2293_05850 [Elusimicrobia bacterium RIFOXYB2_FULL_49_7]|nr:MAG: hypothetical protein A2293_05850 [Elusimicrobia bacterium RIFOXYB2_FULL_49_7]
MDNISNTATANKRPRRLGDKLLDAGIISQAQLSLALSEQNRSGGTLGEMLEKLGFASQAEVSKVLSNELHSEFVTVADAVVDAETLKLVPVAFAKQHQLIPLNREGDILTVAMANTFDIVSIDALEKMTGLQIEVVGAAAHAILDGIDRKYGQTTTIESLVELIMGATDLNDKSGSEAPVVQLVNQIIVLAARKRANDIHLEPEESAVRVRFRIDGILHQEMLFPKALQLVVTSRLKIMGGLDVTEHRQSQDGRIPFKLGYKQIDIRISTLPTQYGESVVLRVLDRTNIILNLDSLGISEREKTLMLDAIKKPHGMILVTGPTGSGKTTTLYAALSQMDSVRNSVFTLEDPIEYCLNMIRQVQINPAVGMTFSSGLRALLRQDPDIILVGEIRDEETAQLATRAALTGHLVLSTLHTNSAAGCVPRLINMGVEPYLISSTLLVVVGQRLVRRICPHCSEPLTNIDKYSKLLNVDLAADSGFRQGKGCPQCFNTGYSGRIAIYEVLHSDHLANLSIHKGITENDVLQAAKAAGMREMIDDGIEKARLGIGSLEDLVRAVG